eukprot:756051-Hanusia_phi.AAC.1
MTPAKTSVTTSTSTSSSSPALFFLACSSSPAFLPRTLRVLAKLSSALAAANGAVPVSRMNRITCSSSAPPQLLLSSPPCSRCPP